MSKISVRYIFLYSTKFFHISLRNRLTNHGIPPFSSVFMLDIPFFYFQCTGSSSLSFLCVCHGPSLHVVNINAKKKRILVVFSFSTCFVFCPQTSVMEHCSILCIVIGQYFEACFVSCVIFPLFSLSNTLSTFPDSHFKTSSWSCGRTVRGNRRRSLPSGESRKLNS